MSEGIFVLLGVILGGLLTGATNYTLERRREKAHAQVGLRLLESEFLRAIAVVEQALDDGFWTRGSETSIETWRDYRAALAGEVSRADWHRLAIGVHAAEMAEKHFAFQLMVGGPTVELSENDRSSLRNILIGIRQAEAVVEKYLAAGFSARLLPARLRPGRNPRRSSPSPPAGS